MADGAAGIGWNFEGGSRMTGVVDVARFRAHRVVRGQRGGVGRTSCRICHRYLLEGPRAHPALWGLVRGLRGEVNT